MATKSVKKVKNKKVKAKPSAKKKTKKAASKSIKKTAKKKTISQVTKTQTSSPKSAKKVAVKKPAKKTVKKSVAIKKVVSQPVRKKIAPPVSVPAKTAAKPVKKSVKKIVKKAVKPSPAPVIKKSAAPSRPAAAKLVTPNSTNLFPRAKTDAGFEQLKFWFILFFVVLVVLLFSQYSGGLISRTYADLHSEVVHNPVIITSGDFYKYEAPANDWEYFNGESLIKSLQRNGVRFDEAWYQEGGKICSSCNGQAAPLVYVKNPSVTLSAPWVKVSQPGFYGSDQYVIHHYY